MDLSIIIVNYKTKKITTDCLESIKKSTDKITKEVIVVDNGSNDGSIEYLAKKFPQYQVYSSGGNVGFAQGNNFGVAKAKGKYVWLLNSDTILEKNTIDTLMKAVKTNNSLIASCRILNPNHTIQPQGGYLPTLGKVALWMLFIDDLPIINRLIKPYHQNLKSYFLSDQSPEWLAGTALLIQRDLYLKMQGLDKNIFMYAEDVDFCWRAKLKNIVVHYYCQPKLIHLGQASGSSQGAILGEYKGLKYLYQKHQPYWQYLVLRLLLKVGALLRLILLRRKIYAQAYQLA